jgi:hypothetical protein
MAAQELKNILNGPVVAGVGATVDAGLTKDKFHVLPWNTTEKLGVRVLEGKDGHELDMDYEGEWYKGSVRDIIKYALYNVDKVLGVDAILSKAASSPEEFKLNLKLDICAIVFLQMCFNYYSGECREASAAEKAEITKAQVPDDLVESIVNVTRINRAATFILARMHTKYQTNHAIGGTPMQASVASAVRAFYSVSPGSARSPSAREQVSCISDCLYWAVHPANETLLIPTVIANSKIEHSTIHHYGPAPSLLAVEEYFQIRARTPPASTHHFYVAAAAIKLLDPLGILPYIPSPSRTSDVIAGLDMIERFGAQLHPAARYWGLERVSANQKLIETMCADLGYAIKKLMPASSLAASPILAKEDGLDSAWKGLIDALRSAMDERGKDLLDNKIFEEIKKAIAPSASELEGVDRIKLYLTSGRTKAIGPAPPAELTPTTKGKGLASETKAPIQAPSATPVPAPTEGPATAGPSRKKRARAVASTAVVPAAALAVPEETEDESDDEGPAEAQ